MAKFRTVAKFATTENGKKLINQMEDYARQYASEKFDGVKLSYDTAYSLNDKAIKINETFASELARRSKYAMGDFDSVEDYANFGTVANMAVLIQKVMLDAVTPILINATGLSMLAEFHYGGYGDVFEFEDCDKAKEQSLYNTYAIHKKWPGSLNNLITNLDYSGTNRLIPEDLGIVRLMCG